jgi:RNA ligase (TIGR02306 family)
MKRKLASVQRVLEVNPITNADAIEAVRINGWQCVVKKGTFAVGDRGVFFEIDAVPPDGPSSNLRGKVRAGLADLLRRLDEPPPPAR